MSVHSVAGMTLDSRCPECRHRVAAHYREDGAAIECSVCAAVESQLASVVVTVGPDDYLLLGWKNASTATLEGIRAKLREQHPGVADRILIANGPDTVAVIKTHGKES